MTHENFSTRVFIYAVKRLSSAWRGPILMLIYVNRRIKFT